MKVEYLVVTQQDGCFCDNEPAFNSLLQVDTQIVIDKNTLTFTQKSKSIEVEYSLQTDEIKDKKQRYFHIKLVAKSEDEIELFTSLVRVIRKIVERLNSNISINNVWDDISRYYIIRAYPLINEVENVMRKLIQKFMIVNVGMDWVNETMPADLKKKIGEKAEKNKSKNILEDTLHNADFIQLSAFLFNKRRGKDFSKLDKLLSEKKADETITFGELAEDFLPISNWDRYFSKLINYKGELLAEKWDKLYELRNKIAHNKSFTKSELNEVRELSSELIEKINETIIELDKIELNTEQKEIIVKEGFGGGFGNPRQMVDGIWICKCCGEFILKLPFEPRDANDVLCRNCHINKRPPRAVGFGNISSHNVIQGNWICNDCGVEITELPFMPSNSKPIFCISCLSTKK